MNVIDGFLLHAKHQPTVAAICAPGWNYSIVSYGRLLFFANNAAAHALACDRCKEGSCGPEGAKVSPEPCSFMPLIRTPMFAPT